MTPLEQCVPEEKENDTNNPPTRAMTDAEALVAYWRGGWNACRNEMLRRIAALNKENDNEK